MGRRFVSAETLCLIAQPGEAASGGPPVALVVSQHQ